MRYLFVAFLLLATPAAALQQQVSVVMNLPAISCGGGALAGGSVFHLEDFVDGILPSTIQITRAIIWYDGGAPIDQTTRGNLAFAVDPGGNYLRRAGHPLHQFEEVQYVKPLGVLELFPEVISATAIPLVYTGQHGTRRHVEDFNPPITYNTGDAIIGGPECTGGGTVAGAELVIFYLADADIPDPPVGPPFYLLNTTLDGDAPPQAGVCDRNLIAAPSVAATQIRVRVHFNENQRFTTPPPFETIPHLSVCRQSGATSSCDATPVELKFNGATGAGPFFWSQWGWSEWAPLAIPAGQGVLVNAAMLNPGATNAWSFKSSGGLGAWFTTGDCWSVQNPSGLTFQSGRTHAIDQVQVR
jgi:hypothetical protein